MHIVTQSGRWVRVRVVSADTNESPLTPEDIKDIGNAVIKLGEDAIRYRGGDD